MCQINGRTNNRVPSKSSHRAPRASPGHNPATNIKPTAAPSQEELQALDANTSKLALPAPKELENQAESGPKSIAEIASEVRKDVIDREV